MSNIIIFEDNENSPISALVRDVFKSVGIDVIFANGNRRIRSIIKQFISYNVIACIDCSPGNISTMQLYKNTAKEYRNYKNISIVPIPCIEYYAICTLICLHNISWCNDYDIFLNCLRDSVESYNRSFERICKSVINNQEICKKNKARSDYWIMGKYWVEKCDCKECQTTVRYSEKVSTFRNWFPLLALSENHHIIDNKMLIDLYTRLDKHYNGTIRYIEYLLNMEETKNGINN